MVRKVQVEYKSNLAHVWDKNYQLKIIQQQVNFNALTKTGKFRQINVQWNLSKADTIGTNKIVDYRECVLCLVVP